MTKKKHKIESEENNALNDPLAIYRNSGIVFSSIETQGDILLTGSMNKDYSERLIMMQQLNNYAFKNNDTKKVSFKNAPIIFSSYEYIP
ncbi:hypothetical protein [Aurantibacillus circumpalustris]|uniref:hypothetical protein n=1 Tax=Aurantibacillus circumpalustris TaxID=3036359 RepID=UPI00295B121B|nr:hypothetical protein [Aurantibacillus circumpalustris]